MTETLFKTDSIRAGLGCAGIASLVMILLVAACSAESGPDGQEAASPVLGNSEVRSLDPPSGPGAMAPSLSSSRDGVLLSWLEPTASGHSFLVAELVGESWSAPRQIATGDAFFANWADLPRVAESVAGTRFAHWLEKLGEDTYAYGATLARSLDDGQSWQQLGLLHDDATPAEHGFVSYAPQSTGGVQAFWLDGRQMPGGGDMQLRTTLLGKGDLAASTVLDDRVCECCATDAATTSAGPVVVYRNRGPSEIRDIAIVRTTAEGWSEPLVIHDDGWHIQGCPVNGPSIAAEGKRLVVAWFTAAQQKATVKVAFSNDAGVHFGAPIAVDDAKPIGRVDVALDQTGRALVSWLAPTGGGAEIRWRRISARAFSSSVSAA